MAQENNQEIVNAKKKALSLYNGDSPEALDQLVSMIEATHAANQKDERAVAAHTSTKELLMGMGRASFSNNSKAFHEIIKECHNVYYSTPIVRNIIDLMTDFASEGLKITHKNENVQNFFNNWARKSGFLTTITNAFHTIILSGNCFILKQEGRISKGDQRSLTKASLQGLEEKDRRKRVIPVGYTILNPLRVEVENSELFGDKNYYFRFTDNDVARLKNPRSEEDIKYIATLPPSFVEEAIKNKRARLNNNRLIVLHYKKLEWQDWAFPLIFSALDDINFKKMLRQMDESSAADVIKAVIIFKLGRMEDGLNPDKQRFQKLSALLKDPSSAKNIVWDNLIEMIDTYPPIEKILGSEKYEVVNRDILSNFGVSEILITGTGSNFAAGFLSVRTLQEKLETIRECLMNGFIDPELEHVTDAMEFSARPYARFASMSLRDEAAEKKILMDLMDRKVVSADTVLETVELDPTTETIRIGRQNKEYPDILSPFDQKSMPTGTNKEIKVPGRPKNTPKPQEVMRNTEPTGLSLGDLESMIKRLHVFIGSKYAEGKKVKTLTNDDFCKVRILVAMAADNIDPYVDNLTDEVIETAIRKTEGIISSGRSILLKKIEKYLDSFEFTKILAEAWFEKLSEE